MFPQQFLPQLASFLSFFPAHLLQNHSSFTLCKIFLSQCKTIRFAQNRHLPIIHLHILPLTHCTYGLSIALASDEEQDPFRESHLQKSIQSALPAIRLRPSSYCFRRHQHIWLFYLEIEKIRGGAFTQEDKRKLSQQLPQELCKKLDPASQSLVFPGNEEEIFKNIRHLASEIRSSADLPQAMIRFLEYGRETIKFLIIVLRVVKPSTPPIASLIHSLPPPMHFCLDHLCYLERTARPRSRSFKGGLAELLGDPRQEFAAHCCPDSLELPVQKVRKKHPKEASVFTIEVNRSLFHKGKYPVHLRAARKYVARCLENLLGPFRDDNGGLLIQEDRQLAEIKHHLERHGYGVEGIEDLFYNLHPLSFRATFSKEIAIELAKLLRKTASLSIPEDQDYLVDWAMTPHVHAIVVKTKDKGWKSTFPHRICSPSLSTGFSSLEEEEFLYLCFFQPSPVDSQMIKTVQQELLHHARHPAPINPGILRINLQGGHPASLNPRLAADIHSHIFSNFLFEGLVRCNESGNVEMAIAQKIEISACKTRYTFHLRTSLWSNGEEVTAYDFEKTWKRTLLSSSAACLRPDFFFLIRNAKLAKEGKVPIQEVGIVAHSASELCVELASPCPYFLNLLATPSFFPMYEMDHEPSVFNGPFLLADHKPERYVFLSQNPFHWNVKNTQIRGIHASFISDPYTAYKEFEQGNLDLLGDPTSPLPPDILQLPHVQNSLCSQTISRVFWIHCNTKRSPFHHPKLRRALSLALNRNQIVKNVFLQQLPQISPLPPPYTNDCADFSGNPSLAKKLFCQALDELGLSLFTFPPITMTHSNLSFEAPLIEELKQQWKEVLGIRILSRPLPWSDFSSALEQGDFELGGLFRRDLFHHPFFYLQFFQNSFDNSHSWEDPEYADYLAKLHKQPNNPHLIKKLERLLILKAPVIPLVSQRYLTLTHPRVQSVGWSQNGCLQLEKVTFHETDPTTHLHDCLHDHGSLSVG